MMPKKSKKPVNAVKTVKVAKVDKKSISVKALRTAKPTKEVMPVITSKVSKSPKPTKPVKTNKTAGSLFNPKNQRAIEVGVLNLVNSSKKLMNAHTINSPRAVGDAIQSLLEEKFGDILPKKYTTNPESVFGRRSMADLIVADSDESIYYIDVKTHNVDTEFNMPNITSVNRLSEFYEEDTNFFIILLVSYEIQGKQIRANKCHFIPIEYMDWDCLRIGALGWGQIQIENSNTILIKESSRKKWMLTLCDTMNNFYEEEIKKIRKERIKYFQEEKTKWQSRKK